MSSKKKIALAVAITAVASSALTLFASAAIFFMPSSDGEDNFEKKLKMIDVILDQKYLYEYDNDEMRETALGAYVGALEEPYTTYYSPREFASYEDGIKDGYTGIGIIVSVNDDNRIEIIAPFEGSPAIDAGIAPGDILKAVDGVEYDGQHLNDAVNVIRGGKEGTTVDLTIIKSGGEEVSVTVERRDIKDESVKTEMLDSSIGYMRISQFNMQSEDGSHSTSTEFEARLDELTDNGMEKLILDLRDNPGGVLPEVINIADELLPEGIIMYTEDKNGERQNYESDAEYVDVPLVVLINGNSASASEVLTGALKDLKRATIVGEKSYGKGIVQDIYTLFDGSGISLTSAKYYTPSGVCIHDIGIEPDETVEMPEEYKNMYTSMIEHDKDPQLQRAIEIIKNK